MLWFLLEFGVSDELVGGEYSTCVQVESRGSCHFWGHPTHSVLETLRLRSGRTEFPTPGEGYRLGGGVRLQEGWVPASAGMTEGEGGGGTGVGVRLQEGWVPASAGMTEGEGGGGTGVGVRLQEGWVPASAGMTEGVGVKGLYMC